MTPAEHELLEIRRAFEKHGLGELCVAADGSIVPHLGVLRLLTFLSQRKETLMPDAIAREESRVANLTLEEASAELSAAVYQAAQLVEQLEGAGKVIGNGHHARQKIASLAVEDLKARWVKNKT